MSELTLVIGNKNYSSWSLRPWLLMKHLGVNFREHLIQLSVPSTRGEIDRQGPSGKIPILRDGELCVWDSLAICEYIAELKGAGWPKDTAARALARSVAAEMHSGFPHLRSQWPMNARARDRHTATTPSLEADIKRVDGLWADCRRRFGAGNGPWLFGEFSVADAMYAPVVLRFNTYGAQVSPLAREYMSAVLDDRHVKEWVSAAERETWVIDSEDVGKKE
jgi:glutathione S-transferase